VFRFVNVTGQFLNFDEQYYFPNNGTKKKKKKKKKKKNDVILYLVNANGVEVQVFHERKVALAVGGLGEGIGEAGGEGPGLVCNALDEELVLCDRIKKLGSLD
jgi:hypothetical protein